MVGGVVIGVARGPEDTLVHVQERTGRRPDSCSIRVVEKRRDNGEPIAIEVGDSIWWQGGDAMWTPKAVAQSGDDRGGGVRYDIRIPRVGFSH
jgi:hypothetical protein